MEKGTSITDKTISLTDGTNWVMEKGTFLTDRTISITNKTNSVTDGTNSVTGQTFSMTGKTNLMTEKGTSVTDKTISMREKGASLTKLSNLPTKCLVLETIVQELNTLHPLAPLPAAIEMKTILIIIFPEPERSRF